jgi:hypothetical protein
MWATSRRAALRQLGAQILTSDLNPFADIFQRRPRSGNTPQLDIA